MAARWAAFVAAMLALACAAAAQSNGGTRSATDGVFTVAQAARGQAMYAMRCAGCHGASLDGGEFEGDEVPPLHGDGFMVAVDAGALYGRIRRLMPRDAPGTLADGAYADVLAFLLRENGFPAGQTELPGSVDALTGLRVAKSVTAPNFSLVRVVGCAGAIADGGRRLASATEPRPAESHETTAAELTAAGVEPLGTATFTLMGAAGTPAARVGDKVYVTGILIRMPAGDRINVISLQPTGVACAAQ